MSSISGSDLCRFYTSSWTQSAAGPSWAWKWLEMGLFTITMRAPRICHGRVTCRMGSSGRCNYQKERIYDELGCHRDTARTGDRVLRTSGSWWAAAFEYTVLLGRSRSFLFGQREGLDLLREKEKGRMARRWNSTGGKTLLLGRALGRTMRGRKICRAGFTKRHRRSAPKGSVERLGGSWPVIADQCGPARHWGAEQRGRRKG